MATLKEFAGTIKDVGDYKIVITGDGKVQLSFEADLIKSLGALLKVEQQPDTWYAKAFAFVKALLPAIGK